MRFIQLFIILMLVIPISIASMDNYDCKSLGVKGLCFSFILKSTSDKGTDYTKYNFPFNLKQGDDIWIEKVIILNKGEDITQNSTFNLNIKPIDGHIKEIHAENYGEYLITIPSLNINDEYELIYNESSKKYNSYLNGEQINHTYRHWKIELYKMGEWIIEEEWEGESGYTALINGGWHNTILLVKTNPIAKGLRLYFDIIKDILIICLMVSSIFISILIAKWQFNKKEEYDKNIQEDILKSIETQLRCITRDIIWHKEDLNKKPLIIPSCDIHHLNPNFYITNLRYQIRGHETESLKEAIILVSNQISKINSILHFAQNIANSQLNEQNPYVIKLKLKDYKHYKELERLIEMLRKDWKKILFH